MPANTITEIVTATLASKTTSSAAHSIWSYLPSDYVSMENLAKCLSQNNTWLTCLRPDNYSLTGGVSGWFDEASGMVVRKVELSAPVLYNQLASLSYGVKVGLAVGAAALVSAPCILHCYSLRQSRLREAAQASRQQAKQKIRDNSIPTGGLPSSPAAPKPLDKRTPKGGLPPQPATRQLLNTSIAQSKPLRAAALKAKKQIAEKAQQSRRSARKKMKASA